MEKLKAKSKKKIKYPATHIVHWISGPCYTCEKHASQLVGIGNVLGGYTPVSLADKGHECMNCVNENKR